VSFEYNGVNSLGEYKEEKPYDHNCPLCGSGEFNMYKASCIAKQGMTHLKSCSSDCSDATFSILARSKTASEREISKHAAKEAKNRLDKSIRAEAKSMIRSDCTYKQIEETLNISKGTIANIKREMGLL
jgi:hypothetical protein